MISATNSDLEAENAKLWAKNAEWEEMFNEAESMVKSATVSIRKQADTINEKDHKLATAEGRVEDLTEQVKAQEQSILSMRAYAQTLKQKLYVKHYPEQDLIAARKENQALQEKVRVLELKVRNRDVWIEGDRQKMQTARDLLR
jgi:predicted RNase H-like nuclease (RuvC/YqgF family)